MYNYTCQHCGSMDLGYQKYVRCLIPVSLEGRDIEYGLSIVDEDKFLSILFGFTCLACGRLVEHCGHVFETENDFIDYLSTPHEQLAEERRLYDAYRPEDESYDGIEV